MEGKRQVDQKRMVYVFQNHFLSFGVFDLVFFDDVILVDRLHCEELFGLFPFNKQDRAKGSPSKDYFWGEIFESDFLLEVFFGEESFGSSSDHFPFLFLAFKILLIGEVIVHDIFSFNLLGSFFFLFLFGSGKMHQTQLILIINRKLVILNFAISLQNVVNDLLSAV